MDDIGRDRVDEVAGAILDGTDVDWLHTESDADDSVRGILRELRLVSSVAAVHRGIAAARSISTLCPLAVPFRWGPLDVIEHVGRGSFGDVYRAWDRQLDREVALKLRQESSRDVDGESGIVEEGRLLARVCHPNVVTVYGAARIEGRVGLWMEYIRGETLEQRLAWRAPLAPADVISIGHDLCDALAAVHAAGLLHRDIKAHNVMVDDAGRVVLMDFGTSREKALEATNESDLAGTPLYLAPEVLDGECATPCSDIYSVCVLLFRLLTGSYPIVGRSAAEIRDKHRIASPVNLRHIRPDVSDALNRIIGRGLSTDPQRRYASAIELSTALTAAATSPRRLVEMFATSVLLVGAAALVWAAHRASPTSTILSVAREIDAGDGAASMAMSPDGRYGAFTYMPTGDLALRDLQTGSERLLSDGGGWFAAYSDRPVIAPDGRHVAYVMYIDTDNTLELRVASVTSGAQVDTRVVMKTGQHEGAYEMAWMPDGRRLCVAMSRSDNTLELGVVAIADGSFRALKSLEWRRPNRLSVSPDGRFVAYDLPVDGASSPRDIFVLALDGSGDTTVVQNPANDMQPLWSPDGSEVVFLSNRTGHDGLWSVSVKDGRATDAPHLIKDNVPASRLLAITRAGTLFYMTPGSNPANIYSMPLASSTAVKPTALTDRLITTNVAPAWSRDGRMLAYYALTTAANSLNGDVVPGVLVIRTAASGKEQTLPLPARTTADSGAGPKWFADDASVLIEVGDPEGSGFGLYRLTLNTANTELLAHLPRSISSYDVSPDGGTIFYALAEPARDRLIKFDVRSRRETVLRERTATEADREVVALSVAPDGTKLATTLIGGAVQVIRSAGGEARDLYRPREREVGTGALRQGLTWGSDEFVYFVQGDNSLWRVPARGGRAERVNVSFDGPIKSPSPTRDGKRLIFSGRLAAQRTPAKIWALDGVLKRH